MENEKLTAYRKFNITLISATNLTDVRHIFRTKVYARVIIGGNKDTIRQTQRDKENGTNPVWNRPMNYKIAETDVLQPGLGLVIELYCHRSLGNDELIGQVTTSVGDLYSQMEQQHSSTTQTWSIKNGSGDLTFSYKFGEKINIKEPSLWRKFVKSGTSALKAGASFSLEMAILASTGVYIPITHDLFSSD